MLDLVVKCWVLPHTHPPPQVSQNCRPIRLEGAPLENSWSNHLILVEILGENLIINQILAQTVFFFSSIDHCCTAGLARSRYGSISNAQKSRYESIYFLVISYIKTSNCFPDFLLPSNLHINISTVKQTPQSNQSQYIG